MLEAEIAGFGASGRNGGWCSALFAGSRAATAKAHGRDAAVALQRALFATVDEVGAVAAAEGIDAHFQKGGTLELATAPIHVAKLQHQVADERTWGFEEADVAWLGPDEAARRGSTSRAVAGRSSRRTAPACIRPAWLGVWPTRPSAAASRSTSRRGSRRSLPRRVDTAGGRVKADVVVRATEGYTPQLPGHQRTLAPLYSLMIATEPLPASFWATVGWEQRETFSDGRHLIIYGQRTADDRIAFGGRGAPYHFGSRVREGFDRDPATFAELRTVLESALPRARRARRSRTSGAVRSACPATGTARWASSRRPVWPGPVATSATGSGRATSPGARSRT